MSASEDRYGARRGYIGLYDSVVISVVMASIMTGSDV